MFYRKWCLHYKNDDNNNNNHNNNNNEKVALVQLLHEGEQQISAILHS